MKAITENVTAEVIHLREQIATQIKNFEEAKDDNQREIASKNLSEVLTGNRKLLVSALPNFPKLLQEIQWTYYNDRSNVLEVYRSFLKKFNTATQPK